MTATPARIRLVRRESEFATAVDAAVLAARPEARDGAGDPLPSFFNSTADAQLLLNERFAFQKSNRKHEAAEVDSGVAGAAALAVTPVLPKARMYDADRPLDLVMIIRGTAIDFETERNSIETDG